jgi:hypothetical protein
MMLEEWEGERYNGIWPGVCMTSGGSGEREEREERKGMALGLDGTEYRWGRYCCA